MGVTAARETTEGHHAGLQRRLRAQHHGQAASGMRAEQSGSEGQDATDRLPPPG